MPENGFLQVPDWFSFENQGAGLASTEIGGTSAVVVFAVDAGPAQNRGVYRVGTGVDQTTGAVTTWSPWHDVPDWFSFENQGAGVAVADISGNGTPDLVVLLVDNPGGQNSGKYRVGFDLTADNGVTGGWTPWIDVPDWFSFENQGADLAIGDLDASGRPDLVVFAIDDVPNGQNRGIYRVGHNLDVQGVPTAWSPWQDAPTWFSWDNSGGGVALVDSATPGRLDIVLFGIDNPPGPFPAPSGTPTGQNQAYYQIGHALAVDGTPTGGWTSLFGVNNWFSWDNQYGALAVLGKGRGNQRLLVGAVDNPPGQNAFFYTALPIVETPQVHGQWQVLPFLSALLPIHGALLHTGKVLFFAGSGNNQVRVNSPIYGNVAQGGWTSVVWDPTAPPPGNIKHLATLTREDGHPFDFFCCGHSFLPDGRVFVAGGNKDYNGGNNLGLRETAVFDPTTEQWTRTATMPEGRWYPTVLTLPDGRALIVSGKNDTDGNTNRRFETYDGTTNLLGELHAPPNVLLPFYAHLFITHDGKVFFDGGRMDDGNPQEAGLLDLAGQPIGFQPIGSQVTTTLRNQSSSVFLPPAQDQQVMIIGGGPPDDVTSATGSTERIDLRQANPTMNSAMPLSLPRMHLNAVLLPDRTVFVSGGAIHHEREEGDVARMPRLQGEIYDPVADRWHPTATATVIRMYHSIALLLPDATVVTACGNPPPYGHDAHWIEQANEELKLEVFSPPYLFRGPRPTITGTATEWTYGATVDIDTPDGNRIMWTEIIHPGSTTHAFDNAQRLVDLAFTAHPGKVSVNTPQDRNLAPPGWYMLFLVDRDRVPSTAAWIHLT